MSRVSRREMLAWAIAAAVVVVGVATTVVGVSTPVSFGWFAYQPLAEARFLPAGESLYLYRTALIGFAITTLGLLGLAFLAGWRVAHRRTSA